MPRNTPSIPALLPREPCFLSFFGGNSGTQHPDRLLTPEYLASGCYQSIADTFVQLFRIGTSDVMASPQSEAIEDVQRQLERKAMSPRRMRWKSRS